MNFSEIESLNSMDIYGLSDDLLMKYHIAIMNEIQYDENMAEELEDILDAITSELELRGLI